MMRSKACSILFSVMPVIVFTTILTLLSSSAYASCEGIMRSSIIGSDRYTASLGVGRINIISNYLQPVGSVLAVGVSNYNSITRGGLANTNDETIILTCTEASDKDKLSWVFATNGDSRIGGFYEIPGYPGYYATQFPYVAIKLTFAETGEVFSRYWQRSSAAVQSEPTNNGSGGFVIKKKHIPKVVATLIKWPNAYFTERNDADGNRAGGTFCAGDNEFMIPTAQTSNPDQVWTADHQAVNGMARGCGQPSGYINLSGTGGTDAHVGRDSNDSVTGWNHSVPVGINGSPAATFSYTPSCVIRTSTPYVLFPTMTISQLKAGESVSRNFDVTLECDNTINPVVSTSSVSVGIQPSLAAFGHAKTLGLIDATTGGVTHLVSDNYGANGVAEGVGITLRNATGNSVNFVSWDGCIPTITSSTSYCAKYSSLTQLRAAGWDPVMSSSTQVSENTATATKTYRKTYTATLARIGNLEPTVGAIKATATVLVRLP